MKKTFKVVTLMVVCLTIMSSNVFAANKQKEKQSKTTEVKEKVSLDKLKTEITKVTNNLELKALEQNLDAKTQELLLQDSVITEKKSGRKVTFQFNPDIKGKMIHHRIQTLQKTQDTDTLIVYTTEGDFDKKYNMEFKWNLVSKRGHFKYTKRDLKNNCIISITKKPTKEEIDAAYKELKTYVDENKEIIDLTKDYTTAQSKIKKAKMPAEVNKLKEDALAAMKQKVEDERKRQAEIAAKEAAAQTDAEQVAQSNAQIEGRVNEFGSALSAFAKSGDKVQQQELLAMFVSADAPVTVSSIKHGNKTKTIKQYLNSLAQLSKANYNKNVDLNIAIDGTPESTESNASVIVKQSFNGNGKYCDTTIKKIYLTQQGDKLVISKIEVVETIACE